MAKKLQEQSHQSVGYNRPNLEWRCGHACSGKSCPLGPNIKGECAGKQSECYPVKKNDRWQCTRSDTYGGKCGQGPNPDGSCCSPLTHCQPIRSLRSKRKIITLVTVSATIGLILLFVGGDFKDSRKIIFNSGKLSSAHSPEEINCMNCHESIAAKSEANAKFSDVHQGANKSSQCLTCHAKEIGHWQTSRFAHGIAPENLEELTAKAQSTVGNDNAGALLQLAGNLSLRDKGVNGELTCATCHKEHNGPDFDLTAMSSEQCQSCHQNKFESFSDGHPEFSDYPYDRKTRIFFDHIKHFQKHFPAQSDEWTKMSTEAGSCNACHTPDQEGNKMVLKSFDQSCASCHSNLTKKGDVAVISIPSMDTQAIKGWPKPPLRGPTRLSPIMELLIALNENSYDSIKDFQEIKDPLSLKGDHEIKKAEKLKTDIQKLITRWREKGGSNIFDSKNSQASPALNKLANDMLSSVPPETFERLLKDLNQAEMDFLEPVKTEIEADLKNKTSKDDHETSKKKPEEKTDSVEEINLFDLVEAKEEVKVETKAEEINLFDLVDNSNESKKVEDVNVDKEPKVGEPKVGISAPIKISSGIKQWAEKRIVADAHNKKLKKKSKPSQKAKKIEEKIAPQEDINLFDLAEVKEEVKLETKVEVKVEAKEEVKVEAEEGEMNLFDLAGESDDSKQVENVDANKKPQAVIPSSISESASGRKQWAEKSHWAYDSFVISYRAQGHADPFLKALIEHSAEETANASAWSGSLGLKILEGTTAGKCLNCHTVDLKKDGSAVVNWNAKESVSSKEFSRFVHTKHTASLLLSKDASVIDAKQQTCFTCHVFSEEIDYASFFPAEKFSQPLKQPIIRDPQLFKSNFKNIDMKNTCARCHTSSEAGDNCLKCHNYHVDKL